MKKQLFSHKRLIPLFYCLCLIFCVNLGWGQNPASATDVVTIGDYRSFANGNWNDAATWQVRGASSWTTASTAPAAGNSVYVQTGHTVTVDVASVSCYSLHINTTGVVALQSNTLNVYGKIRAYTGTAEITTADGTFIGTDATATASSMITTAGAGSGLLKFVGGTRNITFAGEWNSSGTSNPAEFALDLGATGTLPVGVKFRNITFSSGIINSTSFISMSTGTCTIKKGARLISSRSGLTSEVLGNSSTVTGGAMTIEAGGVLELTGTTPAISVSGFVNNGTVIYSKAGAQTFLQSNTAAVGSVATSVLNNYSTLIVSSSGAKTLSSNTFIASNGSVSLQGTATMTAGGFAISYGTGTTLEYARTSSTTIDAEWPAMNSPFNITINSANNVSFSNTSVLPVLRTITGTLTLNSLAVAGASSFTVDDNSGSGGTVPNVLTFANGSKIIRIAGTFNSSGGTYVFGTSSSDIVSLEIGSSTGTPITMTSNSEITSSPTGLVDLTVFPGFTYNLAGNRTVNRLNLNGNLTDNNFTLTVKENIAGTGIHSGTGKVLMSGNATSSAISGATLGNLELNDSDGFTLTGSPTISGILTLAAGTLSVGANTLTFGGTPFVGAGNINASNANATVTFENSTAVVLPASPLFTGNLQNLTINGVGGVTLGSATSLAGKLTLSSGILTTGGFLTLKSGDCCTSATVAQVTGGSVSGDVTVERYIPAGQRAYRLLSSPVTTTTFIDTNWQAGTHITGTDGAINGFDATTSNGSSMFTHNNTTPAWNAVANTNGTVLTAGVPYLTYIRGSRAASLTVVASNPPVSIASDATTLSATGALKIGDVLVNGLNETAGGFSAVGNPYQAQVDMAAALSGINATVSNLDAGFYYVVDPSLGTKGAYLTVDVTAAANAHISKYLQPGQACFVKTTAAGPALLTFKEIHKSEAAGQTTIFRTKNTATASIDLTLSDVNANRLDVLKVAFDANESNELNQNDASKLINFDESLATSNSGKLLAIEKRAIPTDSDEIPLNITKYRGTSYSIKAQGTGLTGSTPYLFDKYTSSTTEIPQDGTVNYAYTVDAAIPASIAADRFKLIYAKTLKTIDNELAGFALYPNPSKSNSFSIVVPQSSSAVSLRVSNLLGQQLYSQNDVQSGATVKVTVNDLKTSGVYLVSLSSEGKTTTTKWIVE